MAYTRKWLPSSYRSSAGQGSSLAERPTYYHCSTEPSLRTAHMCVHVHNTATIVVHNTAQNSSDKLPYCLLRISSARMLSTGGEGDVL